MFQTFLFQTQTVGTVIEFGNINFLSKLIYVIYVMKIHVIDNIAIVLILGTITAV
jgi:hypothetical protein